MESSQFYKHCGILFVILILLYLAIAAIANALWHAPRLFWGALPFAVTEMLWMISQKEWVHNKEELRQWYLRGIVACILGTITILIIYLVWR
jgi:hypothetical protein